MDTGKKRTAPTHPGKPQAPKKPRIVGQDKSMIGNQFSGGFGSSGAVGTELDRNAMLQWIRLDTDFHRSRGTLDDYKAFREEERRFGI